LSDIATVPGEPVPVQYLTPEGELVQPEGHPPVEDDPDRLRGWYRDLVLVRRLDTEAIALQRQGEVGLWPSLLGQEAAQVGSGRALAEHDMAFTTYRDHGVAWCRGMQPIELIGLFRGSTLGGWNPKTHNLMPYAIVIGSQTLHATGYAMGVQRDGAVGTGDPSRDTAVICYFGDGATSQGDVSEAFNYASVFNAPVVFFCQNNGWAISEPNERQFHVPLYQRSRGFGFPGVRVDGNDVLAVHAVTQRALERARAGEGPSLIEAVTYRMGAHTTSDDPTRYRIAAEVEEWKLRDPIARVHAYLARNGLADEDFFAEVEAEAEAMAKQWRAAVRALPDPAPESMFDNLYHEPHPTLDAERAAFAAYEESFSAASAGGEH
jgi:pyruvate dehydrogenase E1 component alpha subunit